MPLFGVMVIKLVVSKVGLDYQPQLLKEFQCPIDGRLVDPGNIFLTLE